MALSAYVLVRTEAKKARAVKRALEKIRGVECACLCWGIPDIFAYVEVKDNKTLRDLVLNNIQAVPGVRETDTHIVIE